MCILFACSLCRVACKGHTWEGGTVLWLHSLSLCQARWLLSLRQEVEQWEEKCKDGRPKPCQSGLSPEPPHLETTCSWLTLLPLSSSLSHFPDGGDGFQTGCDLCLSMSLLFAEEEQEEGVNKGWRDRSNKIFLFYNYSCPRELVVFLCLTFQKNNLSS